MLTRLHNLAVFVLLTQVLSILLKEPIHQDTIHQERAATAPEPD